MTPGDGEGEVACPRCARTAAVDADVLRCSNCGLTLGLEDRDALQDLASQTALVRAHIAALNDELVEAQRELVSLNERRRLLAARLEPDEASSLEVLPPPPTSPTLPPPPMPLAPIGMQPLQPRGARSPWVTSTRTTPPSADWEPIGLRTWLLVIGVGLLLFAGLAFVTVTWPDLNDAQRAGVLSVATGIAAALTVALHRRLPATAEALCVLTFIMLLVDWGALRRAGAGASMDLAVWWALGQAVVAAVAVPAHRLGLRAPMVAVPTLLVGAGVAMAFGFADAAWEFGIGTGLVAAAAIVGGSFVRSDELRLEQQVAELLAALVWPSALLAAWADVADQNFNAVDGSALNLLRPAATLGVAALAPLAVRLVVQRARLGDLARLAVAITATLLFGSLALVLGNTQDTVVVWGVVALAGIAAIVLVRQWPVSLAGLLGAGLVAVAPAGFLAIVDGTSSMFVPFELGYESFSASVHEPVHELAVAARAQELQPVEVPPRDARRPLLAIVACAGLLIAAMPSRRDAPTWNLPVALTGAVLVPLGAATAALTLGPGTVAVAIAGSLLVAGSMVGAAILAAKRREDGARLPGALALIAAGGAIPALGWSRLDGTWAWLVLASLAVIAALAADQLREVWDRQVAAMLAAPLAVAAVWAALAPTWSGSDEALRAALVVAWAAVASLGLARHPRPDAEVWEFLGLTGMFCWACSTLPDRPLSIVALAATAVMIAVAALLRDRAFERGAAPAVAGLVALVWLEHADVQTVEAYTTVAAIGLLCAIAWAQRGLAHLPSRTAYGAPLWIGVGIPVLVALGDDGQVRPVSMFAVCVVLMIVGVHRSLRAPIEVGAVGLLALGVDALAPIATELPRWVALGVSGAVVLWLGATVERRVQEVRAARDRFAALR